jgi:hypothetical protein
MYLGRFMHEIITGALHYIFTEVVKWLNSSLESAHCSYLAVADLVDKATDIAIAEGHCPSSIRTNLNP